MAAVLAALGHRIPRLLANALSIATAAAVGWMAVTLLLARPLVYWFSGWAVVAGKAIGISFAPDAAGAAMVAMASLLTLASLIFSSRYFDTVGTLYHSLMLVFLAAMAGFGLTGDLFNLFVFFELMSAAAFALCGYKSEEAGPLQGALNFAVTNAAGAYLVLSGIGLLYGRTGALNMAEIGRRLAEGRPDALVTGALTMISCGFLVKAAVAPFHFWLADAHAVAPAPVCVLFSGIMVPLGLYAVVRIYWAIFSGALAGHQADLRNLLAVIGVATAVVGAVMCYAQRHFKRLLAFSTISHIGIMLMGAAILTREGLAGTGVYAVSHGLVKGGLFLAAGIVLHRTGTVDELELRRMRHGVSWLAAPVFVGAAGLAEVPPFGTFRGEALMSASTQALGYGWLEWVKFGAAVVTAGAVLRFAAGALLGWGRTPDEEGHEIPERPETQGGHRHTPAVMWVPATALIVLGLLAGMVPGITSEAEKAAAQVKDRAAYAARVLDGATVAAAVATAAPVNAGECARGFGALAAAVLLAFISLRPQRKERRLHRLWRGAMRPLRDLHSGVIPDYVTWLLLGTALFGGAALMWVR